jgi:hypothetical protein
VIRVGVSDVDSTHAYPATNSAGVYNSTSVWFEGGDHCYAVQVLYTNTSGLTANDLPNPIVVENSLPGTLASNWFLGGAATDSTIAAYTDRASYAPGDTVNFKVDSTGNTCRIELYRVGYYGYGTVGARHVLGNQSGYLVPTVVTQPTPTVDGVHSSVSCGWTTNATWTIPSDACPGTYTFLARRTDVGNTTRVCQGVFTVRGNISGGHVVVNPSPTWRAYNPWGATTDNGSSLGAGTWTGYSLYQDGASGATSTFASRATAVSYDCPLATQSMRDMTFFFDTDGLIQFMEAQGINLGYCDEIDLEGNTTYLNSATSVIPIGHHEYISTDMYDAYLNAKVAGVNALWASANNALWRVRFDSTDTAHQLMICYKDSATRDVSAPRIGTGYDPGDSNGSPKVTGTWRDVTATNGVSNPDRRRENTLTGQIFGWSGPIQTTLAIDFAHKGKPVWRNSTAIQALTTGTTFVSGDNDLGYEVDYADGSAGQPTNLVALFAQSFTSSLGANANGTIYSNSVSGTIGWTVYRDTSGALVAHIGWRGSWGVSRRHGTSTYSTSTVSVDIQNAILCLLSDVCRVDAFSTLQGLQQDSDTLPTLPTPYSTRDAAATAYGLTIPSPGPQLDSGSITDAQSIVVSGTHDSDMLQQSSAQSVVVTLSSSDTSLLAEASLVTNVVSGSDVSALADLGTASGNTASDGDQGLMTETQSIFSRIAVADGDAGLIVDNGVVHIGNFVDQNFTSSVKVIMNSDSSVTVTYTSAVHQVVSRGTPNDIALSGTAANIGR